MQVAGRVVVVTGGANGIGRALCEVFHRAGAAKVVVADLDSRRRGSRRGLDRGQSIQVRCRAGEGHPPCHRGNRTAVRPDCAVLLQCRHRRRVRSQVGERRGNFRRAMGEKLGHPCHGACLRRAAFDPAHEGARRGVFSQHDFRRRPAVAGREARPIRRPSMPRWDLRKILRSRTRPTASGFPSCVRRASIPICCGRSRKARNPATAT